MRFKHEKQNALADDFQNTVQLSVTLIKTANQIM